MGVSADFEEEGLWGLLVVLHFLGFFCVGEIIIIGITIPQLLWRSVSIWISIYKSISYPISFLYKPLLQDTQSLLKRHLRIRNPNIFPTNRFGLILTNITVQINNLRKSSKKTTCLWFTLFYIYTIILEKCTCDRSNMKCFRWEELFSRRGRRGMPSGCCSVYRWRCCRVRGILRIFLAFSIWIIRLQRFYTIISIFTLII